MTGENTNGSKRGRRAIGHIFLVLSTGVAGLAIWIIIRNRLDWLDICQGGQSNPHFHSAECKDIETLHIFALPFAVLCALPALIWLLRRVWRVAQS